MIKHQVLGDFETASATDLKKAGAHRYAECPTTEILCFSYSIDSSTPVTWKPGDDTTELMTLAANPFIMFIAHNVGFEKAIWRAIMVPVYGFPDIPNSRWHDTLAVCAMRGLPQDLDRATLVLRLPQQKDRAGSALVKSLSKPNKKTGMLDRSPATMERVYAYCEQDIHAELGLHARIGWLPAGERSVWLLDQRINERGCKLDLDYVHASQRIVAEAFGPLNEEFKALTGYEVTQNAKTLEWVHAQGVSLPNLQKETLDAVLKNSDGDDETGGADTTTEFADFEDGIASIELPETVRRALSIRQLIGSASVKKLARMEGCVLGDGRAYGLLQYHGAGPGRWAGRIIQPQNFPRGSLKNEFDNAPDPQTVVDAIMTGDAALVEMLLGKPAVECVVSGLRHAIISEPERLLVSGDFSTIELRVNLALAGQDDKIAMLARGEDPYCDMASLIFGFLVTKAMKPERQTGKNSVLGLGFQMGAPKFRDKYAKDKPLEWCKDIVDTFRQKWAPGIPKVWYGLEQAAVKTVWDGTPHEAFGVEYRIEDLWLTARLPSGRKLWYYNPQKIRKAMPWDPTDIRRAWTYQAMKMGKWRTIDAYGGHLTENVVQALARDLMVCAMFKAEKNGFPIVLTVHDELLAEPERANADQKALDQIMRDRPDWAAALNIPIATETWIGDRYRK